MKFWGIKINLSSPKEVVIEKEPICGGCGELESICLRSPCKKMTDYLKSRMQGVRF